MMENIQLSNLIQIEKDLKKQNFIPMNSDEKLKQNRDERLQRYIQKINCQIAPFSNLDLPNNIF